MKIFFACHRFPFPPNRGGKIRPFNMIRHLSRRHEVFVASLAHTQQELNEGAGLKEYTAEVYAQVLPEKLRRVKALQALPTRTPSSVAYFSSFKLQRKIIAAAQRISFDAVIVHCAFAAQYGMRVPAKFRLMDFGDLDSGKWLDYSSSRSFPLSWGYYLEGKKLRRYEKQVASSFDYCTLTTQGELEEFEKLNVERAHKVIPNGVDGTYFHAKSTASKVKPVIVFLGRMDYYPNVDAVLHFTKTVLPKIRGAVPNAEFRIVGSNPVPAIGRLQNVSGVVVSGYVPDVRPFLDGAAVSVAPLRMARGTQNKILESMAMGVPVVATPEAAKGVNVVPERHILIGDSPNAFAEQVIRLLKDKQLGVELSNAASRRIAQFHSWNFSMELLDSILNVGDSKLDNGLPGEIECAQQSYIN